MQMLLDLEGKWHFVFMTWEMAMGRHWSQFHFLLGWASQKMNDIWGAPAVCKSLACEMDK